MWNLAVMVVPVLIIVVFFMFMMRQLRVSQSLMDLVRVRLAFYGQDKEKVLFTDIAGNDNAKQVCRRLLIFLSIRRNIKIWAQRFQRRIISR